MKKLYFTLIIFIFAGISLSAQQIIPAEIFSNIKKRSSEVNDYTAEINGNFNLEKFRIPKLKMKIYFKQPDKFHYESENFALLPKGGVNFNPMDYPEDKFNYKLNGKETINNTTVYQLEITPKEVKGKKGEKKDLPEGRTFLWVDSDNWVVKRIVNEKDEMFKVIMEFTHSWIDGKFYMPSELKISYDIKTPAEGEASMDQKSQKRSRIPKMQKGEVLLYISNYKINAGISDDVFKNQKEK